MHERGGGISVGRVIALLVVVLPLFWLLCIASQQFRRGPRLGRSPSVSR
jgi:hypothetical protein